jgi:hypothetical protein
MSPEPRMVEVRRNVLKQNDVTARTLREHFRAEGILAVRLVPSPGEGKTTFLEKTLTLLRPHYRLASTLDAWALSGARAAGLGYRTFWYTNSSKSRSVRMAPSS